MKRQGGGLGGKDGRTSPPPIESEDIAEYISSQSDFGFELRVLRLLREAGWTCEHAGTYEDPLTRKPRQFDIRAFRQVDETTIDIAVECKNLRREAPIVLFAVPRLPQESFHQVVFSFVPQTNRIVPKFVQERARVIRVAGTGSVYEPAEPVGKSYGQVCRDSKGEFKAADPNIYEKWSQALASCRDLIDFAESRAEEFQSPSHFSVVVPFLVVPDGTLWAVPYAEDGSPVGRPARTDWLPYFVEKQPTPFFSVGRLGCDLSHLEFVTVTGLLGRLTFLDSERSTRVFPPAALRDAVDRLRDD